MSRAFVREEDEDLSNLRYGAEYRRKREDWLRIQEKKRDFLLKDPKAATLDPEELVDACNSVGDVADHYDTILHARFGGTLAFEDD